MEKFSIKKGFNQVPVGTSDKLKAELMTAIGIKSRGQWSLYMRGISQLTIDKAKAVEKIFQNYGITDIWENDGSEC